MLEKLKYRFKNMKLSAKMALIYGTFAGAACVISLVALQISLSIYDEKLYEKSLQELDFYTQQVKESLDDIDDLSRTIALDEDIQGILKTMNEKEYMSAAYSVQTGLLRGKIQEKLYAYPRVKNIVYTDGKKMSFTVGEYTGELKKSDEDSLLEQFHTAAGGYVTKNPTDEYPYLVSGRDIREVQNASLDYLGSLIFTSDISGIIGRKNKNLETEHSSLLVYSDDGIVYRDKELENIKLPQISDDSGYRVLHLDGEKYFMCYLRSDATGWMYVNVFLYSEIFGQTMEVRYMLLFGFVILFLALFAALKKMAVVITQPLQQLTESMRIVEKGDFKAAKEVLTADVSLDETGLLKQEFAVMIDKINTLIHENYEKQLLLQDTKYKMLQAQINPHFLYNTLNALNWMVRGGKNDDACVMIMELGKLLRSAFAKDPYTTVADELDTAKGYMTIQQYRYRSRAEFRVKTKGELDTYLVPRMILQPLIENAIYYGVEVSLNKCLIMVSVSEGDDDILMEVSDTGPGMNEEELEQVRNGTVKARGHGIGLKNIRERLSMTYENSVFEVNSILGEGTVIKIRIPKIRTERDHG